MSNNTSLYICDDIFPSLSSEKLVVCLQNNEEQTYHNEIALLDLFYEQQENLKTELMEFQTSVMQKMEQITQDKDSLGYILSSLFFEKSPYKTDYMYLFFKLRLVMYIIQQNNIETLYLYSSHKKIVTFFQNFAKKTNKKVVINTSVSHSTPLKERVMQSGLLSFIFKLTQEYKKKKQKLPLEQQMKKKLVVSYYPSYFFKDGVFFSKYFGDVSKMFSSEYEWLFIYADDISKLSSENTFLQKNNFKNYNFLDNFLDMNDFFLLYRRYRQVNKQWDRDTIKSFFQYDGIDFYSIVEDDIKKSLGAVLIDTLIFEKRFENFFSKRDYKEVLYLMEYQPWEQMLNKVLESQRSDTIRKGVTHSVVRPNLLNYFYSKEIHQKMFIPHIVGANGSFIEEVFKQNGFNQKQVFPIEAQRFLYLDGIKHNTLQTNALLITTSIDYKETYELLDFFAKAYQEGTFEKIYIKAHPDLAVDSIIEKLNFFPSYTLLSGNMQDAFSYVDVVYSANSSSVLLEALMNGKKTITMFSLTSLPMPAIETHPLLYIATTIKKLQNILSNITTYDVSTVEVDMQQVLYLDKELTMWKRFIDV